MQLTGPKVTLCERTLCILLDFSLHTNYVFRFCYCTSKQLYFKLGREYINESCIAEGGGGSGVTVGYTGLRILILNITDYQSDF